MPQARHNNWAWPGRVHAARWLWLQAANTNHRDAMRAMWRRCRMHPAQPSAHRKEAVAMALAPVPLLPATAPPPPLPTFSLTALPGSPPPFPAAGDTAGGQGQQGGAAGSSQRSDGGPFSGSRCRARRLSRRSGRSLGSACASCRVGRRPCGPGEEEKGAWEGAWRVGGSVPGIACAGTIVPATPRVCWGGVGWSRRGCMRAAGRQPGLPGAVSMQSGSMACRSSQPAASRCRLAWHHSPGQRPPAAP